MGLRSGFVSEVIAAYEDEQDEMDLIQVHVGNIFDEEEQDEEKENALRHRRNERKQKSNSRFVHEVDDEEKEERIGRLELSMRNISRSNRNWR